MAKTKETPEEKDTENKAESPDESFVAKLSVKALGCDPHLNKGQNKKVLFRVFGKAQGLKMGENRTTGDPWTALQGTFEAVNVEEGSDDYGKVLRSGKLFLPGGIQDVIEGAVREIEHSVSGAGTAAVTFALEISSIRAENPIGYSYEARNLVQRKTQDELAELRAAVEDKAGKVKLLKPATA